MTSDERDLDLPWLSPLDDPRARIARARAEQTEPVLDEGPEPEVGYEERHRRDYFEEIQGEMDGTIGEEDPFAGPDERSHDRWAAINETC